MKVRDLIERLQLIDSELEVLIIDDDYDPHAIENININEIYNNETENGDSPLCIKIN